MPRHSQGLQRHVQVFCDDSKRNQSISATSHADRAWQDSEVVWTKNSKWSFRISDLFLFSFLLRSLQYNGPSQSITQVYGINILYRQHKAAHCQQCSRRSSRKCSRKSNMVWIETCTYCRSCNNAQAGFSNFHQWHAAYNKIRNL